MTLTETISIRRHPAGMLLYTENMAGRSTRQPEQRLVPDAPVLNDLTQPVAPEITNVYNIINYSNNKVFF